MDTSHCDVTSHCCSLRATNWGNRLQRWISDYNIQIYKHESYRTSTLNIISLNTTLTYTVKTTKKTSNYTKRMNTYYIIHTQTILTCSSEMFYISIIVYTIDNMIEHFRMKIVYLQKRNFVYCCILIVSSSKILKSRWFDVHL